MTCSAIATVQERGRIQVKGKGQMLTYFLSGRTRKHDHMLA
jgi:hypothetical protein